MIILELLFHPFTAILVVVGCGLYFLAKHDTEIYKKRLAQEKAEREERTKPLRIRDVVAFNPAEKTICRESEPFAVPLVIISRTDTTPFGASLVHIVKHTTHAQSDGKLIHFAETVAPRVFNVSLDDHTWVVKAPSPDMLVPLNPHDALGIELTREDLLEFVTTRFTPYSAVLGDAPPRTETAERHLAIRLNFRDAYVRLPMTPHIYRVVGHLTTASDVLRDTPTHLVNHRTPSANRPIVTETN